MQTGLYSVLSLPRPGGVRTARETFRIGLRLLIAGLVGAALVHLVVYHVPQNRPLGPQWMAVARDLLVQCPVALPLGAIALTALLAIVRTRAELSGLERLDAALTRLLANRNLTIPDTYEVAPRSAVHLIMLIGGVLAIQLVALGIFDLICPMQVTMVMHGAIMTMDMAPVLPMLPVHLLVAVSLGLAMWRLERRVIRLRARIVWWLHLLGWAGSKQSSHPPVPLIVIPRGWYGFTLFARPPPSTTCR